MIDWLNWTELNWWNQVPWSSFFWMLNFKPVFHFYLHQEGAVHGVTNSWTDWATGLNWLMYIQSGMPSKDLIFYHPFLLLPSIFLSIRIFSKESVLQIRWPKYCCFSVNISSNKYSGLISFRMDWLGLPEVQETLKSLLQHRSSKASILRCSAFFIVQLSHPYTTPGKTIALTRQTFVGKLMSLLFNMLSKLVTAFLQRSKHFFFFNLMAAATICSDFGAPKNKCHCLHCFPIYLPWSDGARCHDLSLQNAEF